jgi:ABC-type Fe3+/spermidine/putrescine transport system ATPase subunit
MGIQEKLFCSNRRNLIMLEIKGLSKSFGSVKAINNVSLEIPSGSTTTILGPSGSGKTTHKKSGHL